ncbi:MAG TPA: hypothetical protein VF167_02825 [Longimicrobiaceae bacterium]
MKASKWMRRSSLAVLALAAILGGCEQADSGLTLEPKHEEEQILLSWKFGNGYTVVAETEESVGSVEAIIGPAGGTLALGKHLLLVPQGAVTADTKFRIVKEDGDHVRLHLTASRHGDNDVGRLGFRRPVRLMLSYEGARNVSSSQVNGLQVMYIRPDQKVEPLPSMVNYYDRWVGTDLRHFSEYGIGWPNLTRTVTGLLGGLLGGLF